MDENQLISLRRRLHACAELGFREFETASIVAHLLREWGLEVHEGIGRTGVVGVLRRDAGPTLAYRADMDALPIKEETGLDFASKTGCMHACGHDAHTAIALGLAKTLSGQKKQGRSVVFVFQGNEEGAPGSGPSGAQAMIDDGVLERFEIGQMLALHCEPELEVGRIGGRSGAMWAASGRFELLVRGEASHGAYPERGKDALKAAAGMVDALYANLSSELSKDEERFSVCRFEAGCAFNIIAPLAHLEGLVRAPSFDAIAVIEKRVRGIVESVAQRFGVQVQLQMHQGADAVINDEALSQRVMAVLRAEGLAEEVQMRLGSEDFSFFSRRVPSFYALLGIRPVGVTQVAPLHSPHFTVDEKALWIGHNAMRAVIDGLS